MKAVLLLLGIGIIWVTSLYILLYLFLKIADKGEKKQYIKKMNTEDKLKDLAKRYDIYRKGDNKNDNRKA